MKYPFILITSLFIIFFDIAFVVAQSEAINFENLVISMKQESSRGFMAGLQSPYEVTLFGNGTVTFDGMDEGKAISRYEPPIKVFRKYRISKTQLKELINEFERIGFFSLYNEYCCRDNGDGTFTKIFDGGLATVITSISINGKTKTVKNINFAPEKLIELQRNIYLVSNVSRFLKFPPYWFSIFPNQMFPPRSPNGESQFKPIVPTIALRKIPRPSPKDGKEGQIDLEKRWGFIKPCVTTKAELEKVLSQPTNDNDGQNLPIYNFKTEKLQVLYANEHTNKEICGSFVPVNTVVLFLVTPIRDTKLSDLKIDLKNFKENGNYEAGIKSYVNLQEGLRIETETVQFNDKKFLEMVTNIHISRKLPKSNNIQSR